MWNETWQPLIDEGKLTVLGIVQEQHSERTRLYRQWRQFSWPIAQDALNLMRVKAVPIIVALDENGVVVSHNATPKFLDRWLNEGIEVEATGKWEFEELDKKMGEAREQFLWHGKAGLSRAIEIYGELTDGPMDSSPEVHFEIGVAYRERFEQKGDPDDFQRAIDHWSTALSLDPSQYIYRRRIQQYGARLDKPYPFYDWIDTAREEIRERGDDPVDLKVPLSGAEVASPQRRFESQAGNADWSEASRIDAASPDTIQAAAVAVPAAVKPGEATRVHVVVKPGPQAKWNNESEPMQLVIRDIEGVELSRNTWVHEFDGPAESSEVRRFEFEVLLKEESPITLQAAVLANVCMNESGICTYLRKPLEISIDSKK